MKARTPDGIELEFEVYGSGELDVLFLHGWGNAASFWDDLLTNHLSLNGLRCITASYRGHGGSSPAPDGYNADQFARDMFAVADAAGARQLIVVGFSMAAKFAPAMALVDPARVRAQVLIAPVGPDAVDIPEEVFDGWIGAAGDAVQFAGLLQAFITRPIEDRLLHLYCANVARASRAALKGTSDMCSRESLVNRIRNVRIPTLIVTGEGDPLLPPSYVREEVLAYFPQARLIALPCGHEIPYEMPTATAWLLEAFLAAIPEEAADTATTSVGTSPAHSSEASPTSAG
jgi:pimeloyl-ACP methyl ester carboxylesterase